MQMIRCTTDDVRLLGLIARETYRETFAAHNTPEDMAAYLDRAFNPQQLLAELANPASAFFLAYAEEEPVGYLKLNEAPAQTELNDANSLELERIYLRSDRQGLGEGRRLLEFAVTQARTAGKAYLWLGVWEHNRRALAFYEKHGFTEFAEHAFWMGNDKQRDLLLRIDLKQ